MFFALRWAFETAVQGAFRLTTTLWQDNMSICMSASLLLQVTDEWMSNLRGLSDTDSKHKGRNLLWQYQVWPLCATSGSISFEQLIVALNSVWHWMGKEWLCLSEIFLAKCTMTDRLGLEKIIIPSWGLWTLNTVWLWQQISETCTWENIPSSRVLGLCFYCSVTLHL